MRVNVGFTDVALSPPKAKRLQSPQQLCPTHGAQDIADLSRWASEHRARPALARLVSTSVRTSDQENYDDNDDDDDSREYEFADEDEHTFKTTDYAERPRSLSIGDWTLARILVLVVRQTALFCMSSSLHRVLSDFLDKPRECCLG